MEEKKQTEQPAKEETFVDHVIRGDRPYGILRARQELMDKLFIEKKT